MWATVLPANLKVMSTANTPPHMEYTAHTVRIKPYEKSHSCNLYVCVCAVIKAIKVNDVK